MKRNILVAASLMLFAASVHAQGTPEQAKADAQTQTDRIHELVKEAREAECPTLQRNLKNQIAAIRKEQAARAASSAANPCLGVKDAAAKPADQLSPECRTVVSNLDEKMKDLVRSVGYEEERLYGLSGTAGFVVDVEEDFRQHASDLTPAQVSALHAVARAKEDLGAVVETQNKLDTLETLPVELTKVKAAPSRRLPEDSECYRLPGNRIHCPPMR